MKTKLFLHYFVVAILIGGVFLYKELTTSKAEEGTFDHSTCQYPERSTNPPDGCDNSDPCDPANAAKGGSGACQSNNQAETTKESTPVVVPQPENQTKKTGQCNE